MKKILSLILALALAVSCCALFGGTAKAEDAVITKVALVTDVGTIDDESFNQACWQGVKAWCEANGIEYTYYQPTEDSTDARVLSVAQAISEGANVVVMPGYLFGATVLTVQDEFPDVYFIAVDVGAGDLTLDYVDYYDPSANVACLTFSEEQAGYLAGYAAVKEGYTKLGFLGGMAVPAVIRYGYGYVQGVDAAAKELGITVDMKYAYGNQFYGDADITAVMDTWYADGTEVVFACGGGIYTSAAEAAKKVNAKVIGVDVDQKGIIDGDYGEGMTVTSAMKGLYPTTINALTDIIVGGKWADYAGKIETLGLVSGDDPAANYVQLAETTQFADGKFSKDDYAALVKGMFDGTITVSKDTSVEPAVTNVNVSWLGNLK